MAVLANDVRPIPSNLRDGIDVSSVTKNDLLERADVVSLNCALMQETEARRDDELGLFGPDRYLINTSWGELINESALVATLDNDEIAGAALNVFHQEPLPADHPLSDLEDVILGYTTHKIRARLSPASTIG